MMRLGPRAVTAAVCALLLLATSTAAAPCGAAPGQCCEGASCVAGQQCVAGFCKPCGGAGDSCCAGVATCGANLACTNGTCSAAPACGVTNGPCCASDACGINLVCKRPYNNPQGSCVPLTSACGSVNQACCAGDSCVSPTLVCAATPNGGGKVCMGCGGAGAPCCAGPNSESCLGTLICGSNGHCTAPPPPCGGPSQPCCSGGCSGTDLRCDAKTDTCMACGGLGQMCCSNGGCRDAFDGFRSVSTGCTSPTYSKDPIGTCQECGGPGQICCPSTAGDGFTFGACSDGTVCTTPTPGDDPHLSRCTPCGEEGQACCGPYRDQCRTGSSKWAFICLGDMSGRTKCTKVDRCHQCGNDVTAPAFVGLLHNATA